MTTDAAVKAPVAADDIDLDFVREVLKKYSTVRGGIIPIMQKVQVHFGYLPKEAIRLIAKTLRVSEAQLVGVATFYAQFRLTPRGKYMFKICCGTACHVKGAQKLIEIAKEKMGVKIGETSPDKLFTPERVACIGACSLAPLITVNDEAIGYLTNDSFTEIIDNLIAKEAAAG
ncbi:MAG: NAD(P)H-dependent oxidoreductase subunit E [Nitrospinae bacterium]|nr:NAD(P)H-dependent oxidoreductase subunit E [Nitrospinota bacterium]